jgi:hypothetical protein
VDVSISSVVPRMVADLRPAADASATARIERPPLAVAVGNPAPTVSLVQEGLVTRSAIEPAAEADLAAHAVQRVLKPWGVPMLPWDSSSGSSEEAETIAAKNAPAVNGAALEEPAPALEAGGPPDEVHLQGKPSSGATDASS